MASILPLSDCLEPVQIKGEIWNLTTYQPPTKGEKGHWRISLEGLGWFLNYEVAEKTAVIQVSSFFFQTNVNLSQLSRRKKHIFLGLFGWRTSLSNLCHLVRFSKCFTSSNGAFLSSHHGQRWIRWQRYDISQESDLQKIPLPSSKNRSQPNQKCWQEQFLCFLETVPDVKFVLEGVRLVFGWCSGSIPLDYTFYHPEAGSTQPHNCRALIQQKWHVSFLSSRGGSSFKT